MAGVSQTVVHNTLLSTTFNNARDEIADNIFRKSAFWAKMQMEGRKDLEDGGAKLQRAVEYGVNSTIGSYEGFETVDLTPQDVVTDAFERWAEVAGSVSVSQRDKDINKGRARVINFLETLTRNLEKSYGQKMNEYALKPTGTNYAAGNGGKDPVPLSVICSLAANTCHEIAESTYSWWAPQRKLSTTSDDTATTSTVFKNEIRNFYNTCSRNNEGSPNLILTGQETAETIEASMEAQVRYQQTELASLGFGGNVRINRADVVWDQIVPGTAANPGDAPANSAFLDHDDSNLDEEIAFFLNTDYLKWVAHQDRDMVMTPFVDAHVNGQTASSALMLCMGNLMCTNRRTQGILYGLDVSAVTY